MEIQVKGATLEADYDVIKGEPMQYHDGNGLGRPGVPDSVEVNYVLWTDAQMQAHDVTNLISDLNMMGEVEDAIEALID